MVPNLIIYTLPNNTLMRAEIRESIAVVLAIGSDAAASIWSIVMMALKAHF
jgi:Trk K+ transport system NAD-binding subunit